MLVIKKNAFLMIDSVIIRVDLTNILSVLYGLSTKKSIVIGTLLVVDD